MKSMRIALAATVALCAVCVVQGPARAQVIVNDPAAIVQLLKSYTQELKGYATQLQQLQQEVQTAQYEMSTFNSLVQNPNLGTAMALMNQAGLGSTLPISPYAVQGLINGQGGISGTLGALSTLANSSFNTNLVYSCTDNSWQCQQQKNTANGLAGSQSVALNALQTLQSHVPILASIRTQLATATAPAQRENAMAALQTEEAWTAEQGNQLMAANILVSTQARVRQEQAQERLNQSIDHVLASMPQQ